jgi:hypothetical protein
VECSIFDVDEDHDVDLKDAAELMDVAAG